MPPSARSGSNPAARPAGAPVAAPRDGGRPEAPGDPQPARRPRPHPGRCLLALPRPAALGLGAPGEPVNLAMQDAPRPRAATRSPPAAALEVLDAVALARPAHRGQRRRTPGARSAPGHDRPGAPLRAVRGRSAQRVRRGTITACPTLNPACANGSAAPPGSPSSRPRSASPSRTAWRGHRGRDLAAGRHLAPHVLQLLPEQGTGDPRGRPAPCRTTRRLQAFVAGGPTGTCSRDVGALLVHSARELIEERGLIDERQQVLRANPELFSRGWRR